MRTAPTFGFRLRMVSASASSRLRLSFSSVVTMTNDDDCLDDTNRRFCFFSFRFSPVPHTRVGRPAGRPYNPFDFQLPDPSRHLLFIGQLDIGNWDLVITRRGLRLKTVSATSSFCLSFSSVVKRTADDDFFDATPASPKHNLHEISSWRRRVAEAFLSETDNQGFGDGSVWKKSMTRTVPFYVNGCSGFFFYPSTRSLRSLAQGKPSILAGEWPFAPTSRFLFSPVVLLPF